MTTHISKDEARKPDIITAELKKGFQWTTQHTKLVSTLIVVFIVVGAGAAGYSEIKLKNETQAQEAYFRLEKDLLKKKLAFEKFQAEQLNPELKAKANSQEPPGQKPTGELEKDYGNIIKDISAFIGQNPNTKAARMGSLTLSDLYLKYKKPDLALSLLNQVQKESDILSAMVISQTGTAQAEMNDCKAAIQTWDQITKVESYKFLHPEVRLKQGLCYEQLKDKTNAEAAYNKVIAEAKDGQLAKTAEKYLRLLKTTE